MFDHQEKEIIRFIENSALNQVLEKREVKLVKAAFSFDDLPANEFMVPWRKVIFLTTQMDYHEVQRIH